MRQTEINIQEYLPHRKPMLMVDRIVEIGDRKVTTSFKIKQENIFTENGKLTETGLIENIAQTCSAITGQNFANDIQQLKNPGSQIIGFITNIKKIKIFDLPEVGDQIISQAVLKSQFGEICTIVCETFFNEKLLVEAEISLLIKIL